MAVRIADTIKQMNDADFPVAYAGDVAISDTDNTTVKEKLNALDEKTKDLIEDVSLTWEEGAIDGSTGNNSASTTTCRTADFFDIDVLCSISVITKKLLFAYNDIKEYLGYITIPQNTTLTK